MKVNRAQLANILGVSTASLSRMVKQGMPVDIQPDTASRQLQFDTATVIDWLVQGPVAYPLPKQIAEAKTRRKVAEAGLRELELGERQRLLFHTEEAINQFNEQLAVVKTNLMSGPSRIAHEMALTSDPGTVRKLLLEEFEEAVSVLTGFDPAAVP